MALDVSDSQVNVIHPPPTLSLTHHFSYNTLFTKRPY